MAQYTALVGPVLVPPAPSVPELSWLPSDNYRPVQARAASYDWTVQPIFQAYDPRNLEWLPRDGYFGRAPAQSLQDWTVQPIFRAYDPRNLEWLPRDGYFGRASTQSLQDWSVQPIFQPPPVPGYDPQNMEWLPRDSYAGRALPRIERDWSVISGEPIVGEPVAPEGPFPIGRPVYYRRRKKPQEELRDLLEEAVEDLHEAPQAIQVEAARILRPVTERPKARRAPPPSRVDFRALEEDIAMVRALVTLWQRYREDEEDEFWLLNS